MQMGANLQVINNNLGHLVIVIKKRSDELKNCYERIKINFILMIFFLLIFFILYH